jgi:hypothetical protein
VTATLLAVLVTLPAPGQTARQIVDRALEHSTLGAEGSQARVTMVLTSARRTQRQRDLMVWSQKRKGRVSSLVRILAPPDVAGTSFLLRERARGPDDMWLYVPALKRVRRIVGKARQGRFLGSDFTYSDLEARGLRNARLRRLPDGRIGRFACFVIEARPAPNSGSPYGRIVAWIRKDNYVAIRLKMYDRQGRLTKKLFVRRIGHVRGRLVIKESRMVTVTAGTSTLLRLRSTRPLGGRTRDLFTVRNLARGL